MHKNTTKSHEALFVTSQKIGEAAQTLENDPDELLTVEEIAVKMKVPTSFFYAPCRRRGPDAIPVLQIGKYLRYHYPTVRAYFAKRSGGHE